MSGTFECSEVPMQTLKPTEGGTEILIIPAGEKVINCTGCGVLVICCLLACVFYGVNTHGIPVSGNG